MSMHDYTKLEDPYEKNIEMKDISYMLLLEKTNLKNSCDKNNQEKCSININYQDNMIHIKHNETNIEIPTNYKLQQNSSKSKVKKNKISQNLVFIWFAILIIMYVIIIKDIIIDQMINMLTTLFYLLDIATMYAYVIKKTHYKYAFTKIFMNLIIFIEIFLGIIMIVMFFQNLNNGIIFPLIIVIIKVFLGVFLILD